MKAAQKNRHGRSALIWVLVLCLLVAAGVFGLKLTHKIQLFSHKPKPAPVTASQSTKGEPAPTPQSAASGSSTTTQPGDQKSDTGGTTTVDLIAPTGDFVSAHNVSPTSTISSVCNTSPGASCTISFVSSNGTSKSLISMTADRGGSAYWNSWTPQSIGLTPGSWQIKATSSLSGQSKTSTDARALVVSS